ncbi:MAG: endonuclease [Bacteroidota bacterium]
MSKPLLLFGAFLSFSFTLSAQTLNANPASLDFGIVSENQPDSQSVMLRNPSGQPVEVYDIQSFDRYGDSPWSVSLSSFTIAAGDSQQVWIKARPRHNVLHQSPLVVLHSGNRGSLAIPLSMQGRYSKPYYQSTENLEEQALVSALKARLAQGYITKSYSQARDEMYMNIDNRRVNGQGASVNTLVGVYTQFTVTSYTSRTDAQNQGFNTEHTYPQGFFNQQLPERSDLFHLFPTKINANSERGSLPFGNVSGNGVWSEGGSKRSSSRFEPRDDHKGQVARAMLYFVVRYGNYAGHLTSQETTLRQWHEAFPPTAVERKRNDDIFAFQNNRNPFIDYPQFAERIRIVSSASSAPNLYSLFLAEDSLLYDTVYVQYPTHFSLPIVNTGRQPLNIENLTLGSADLTFVDSSGQNLVLAPGQGTTVTVQLKASQSGPFASTLSFTTDDPANPSYSLPVEAFVASGTAVEPDWGQGLRIFPNPTDADLRLELTTLPSETLRINLYDLQGRKLGQEITWDRQRARMLISLERLPKGLYLVEVGQAGEVVRRLVEKR